MLRVSLRNLLVGKVRLVLTLLAVTVGVSFVSGTFVLSDTMVKAFDELFTGLSSGTDVVVRSATPYDMDITTTGGQLRPIDQSVVQTVRRVPGVAAAAGSVSGFALIIDKTGHPIQPGGAPTFATSISEDRELAGAGTIREGRRPHAPGEVIVDARTAARAGFAIGDQVQVVFARGHRSFTLVGIFGFGKNDSLLGATMAGFDLPTAQRVLGKTGVVDQVDVRGDPGISADELRGRIAAVVPTGVAVLTGAQVASDSTQSVADAMGIFTTVLLVFAGVSLLVGSFVIWNTFNVLVAQRRREIALLRAVGATRRQVLGGVLAEAGTIGLVAGLLGLAAGVGLAAAIRALLSFIGVDLPSTTPAVELRTVLAALLVGVVVTCLAALLPAWSATRVTPMEALQGNAPSDTVSGRARHLAGWAVLTAGAALLVGCALVGGQKWGTVIAALTTFLGLAFVGPSVVRHLAGLAGHGRRGGAWRLAARNLARNARRAAATASALTIGLTVVVAVAVTAASLKDSVTDAVDGGNRSDLILQPMGAGLGISSSIAGRLRSNPELRDVVEMREWGAEVGGSGAMVTGLDVRGLGHVLDLGVETGSLTGLRGGGILVGSDEAARLGVRTGDRVDVVFPETGHRSMRVAGTFSKGSLINASYIVSMARFQANVSSRLDAAILVTASPGIGAARARATVARAVADYPNVSVNTPADVTRNAQHSVDQLLGIVTALLLLAVIVAVLGIVNTLVLSVVERTRELALLRAVGATRRQVRTLVRRESVLMSLLGAVTGVALGTASGVALARALSDEGITTVTVPLVTLVVYVVVGLAIGVLAAIGPARRASRVAILEALAAE